MPCRPCRPASYNDSKVMCDDRSSRKLVAYLEYFIFSIKNCK